VRRKPLAFRVGEHAQRTHAEPQQQLVVDPGIVRRALSVESRQRPGDRTAVREGLGASAQAVESHDARKAHDGVLGTKVELAQAPDYVVTGLPHGGRVDHEHRPPAATELSRNHQRARPELTLATERRNAHEVQVFDPGEGEQPGAGCWRADHVVVREWLTVVAVRVGIHVADRVTRARQERLVRALPGHRTPHAHQTGILQRRGDESGRARRDRQPAEDLLVLDALRAAGAYPLHDEIEAVRLVRADVVVVHRRAQCLARTRAQCRKRERLTPAGQRDRRRHASVHYAHDHGVAAAAVEELLDRVGERARLPQPAEQVVELGKTVDGDGAVDRAAQRAADERGHGSRTTRNGAVRAGPFRDDNAAEGRIAQAAPALCG